MSDQSEVIDNDYLFCIYIIVTWIWYLAYPRHPRPKKDEKKKMILELIKIVNYMV